MLKVDPALNHLPVRREYIVTLLESVNQPLVNIPAFGTAQTAAYILGTCSEQGMFAVFVYLRQPETNGTLIYVSEPRYLTAEQYRVEEAEATRFVESMGFLMSNVNFRELTPDQQDQLMMRSPMFRPPQAAPPPVLGGRPMDAPMDLVEVADDVQQLESAFDGPDAIFGGLGREREAFRRAGLIGEPGFGAPTPTGPMTRGVPARPEDPEALARLGRLLATFALVFSLWPAGGCQTARPADEPLDRVEQTTFDLAQEHVGQGRFREAIPELEKVLETAPDAADVVHLLGVCYVSLGQEDVGERHLRRAVELDDKFSVAKNTLGAFLVGKGRCEEAKVLLSAVLRDILYPTPQFAEHNLAKAEHCAGDTPAAVARLRRLVVQRPSFCLGYLTLATMSVETKDAEGAIQACDDFRASCLENEKFAKMISHEHRDLCYLQKGLALAQLGDVEGAREQLESCSGEGTLGRECKKSLQLLAQ